MPPRSRKPVTFVERHGLWNEAQAKAAAQVERRISKEKLEVVRFSFADQHGVLRGKTLIASDAAQAMRSGVTMTTTLLAKDTSHHTVYPVFTPGGGFAMEEMQGGGDFVMVEFNEERDVNGRDEIPLKKAWDKMVDLEVNQYKQELVLNAGRDTIRYLAVGKADGGAKIVVIFLHGWHGDRTLAMEDLRFGGNFNRLKNLMVLNGGV